MSNSVPHSTSKSRTFRPWPDNQTQFAFAESQRLNVSELLNEIVSKHFKSHVRQKLAATQRELERQFGPARSRHSKPKVSITKKRN